MCPSIKGVNALVATNAIFGSRRARADQRHNTYRAVLAQAHTDQCFDQVCIRGPERRSVAAKLARPPTEHLDNLFSGDVGHGCEDRRSFNRVRHGFRVAASERREVGALNPLKTLMQLSDAHRAALPASQIRPRG
jgi:hypothetical protein